MVGAAICAGLADPRRIQAAGASCCGAQALTRRPAPPAAARAAPWRASGRGCRRASAASSPARFPPWPPPCSSAASPALVRRGRGGALRICKGTEPLQPCQHLRPPRHPAGPRSCNSCCLKPAQRQHPPGLPGTSAPPHRRRQTPACSRCCCAWCPQSCATCGWCCTGRPCRPRLCCSCSGVGERAGLQQRGRRRCAWWRNRRRRRRRSEAAAQRRLARL